MGRLARTVLTGAGAGAAGTTALNAASYLDMVVRARPASSTPQTTVEAMAGKAGVVIPGSDEERANRLEGLGPLAGIGVGVCVGAVAGVVHRVLGRRLPAPVEAVLLGAAALALSNLPMARLGVTDPTRWTRADWASDAVPHLAYGIVTCAGLRAADDR